MRTVQMILDDNLVKAVDRVSKELHCDHLQIVSICKIGALITSLPGTKTIEVGRATRFALNI